MCRRRAFVCARRLQGRTFRGERAAEGPVGQRGGNALEAHHVAPRVEPLYDLHAARNFQQACVRPHRSCQAAPEHVELGSGEQVHVADLRISPVGKRSGPKDVAVMTDYRRRTHGLYLPRLSAGFDTDRV
jgi:hypothetical protein